MLSMHRGKLRTLRLLIVSGCFTKTIKMGLWVISWRELGGMVERVSWRWHWICWCAEKGALSLCWYDVTYHFLHKFCYRGIQEQCCGSGTIFPDPTLAKFWIQFQSGSKSGFRPNITQFSKIFWRHCQRSARWIWLKEGSFDRSLLKKEARMFFRKIRLFPILCEPFKDSAPPFTAGGY